MKEYYKKKSDFHFKQWNMAKDEGKEKAASYHMTEYINYAEMLKMTEKTEGGEV